MKASIKSVFAVIMVSYAAISNVSAEADYAAQAAGTMTRATTHVDISVVVREVLVFGLSATADNLPLLIWAVTAGATEGNNQSYSGEASVFSGSAPLNTSPTAAISGNGGTVASATNNVASLPVFLFSNNGIDVTISASVGGDDRAGTDESLDHATLTNTLAIDQFRSGDGGKISHPSLISGLSMDTATDTNGMINRSDTWTWTPEVIPGTGQYQARITYVAAQP